MVAGEDGTGKRRPSWRRRLAIASIALLVALVGAEIGLRIYARSAHRERGMDFHPELGWHMRANVTKTGAQWCVKTPATTNSDGWKDGEWAETKAPGTRRIVVLGDSFTFGVGVDYGERFTEHLETLVDDVEVLNMGCNAYGTDQQLRVLELEGLDHDPDVVLLVAFPGNDLLDIRYERNGHWPKPYYRLEEGELVFVPARPNWEVHLRTSSYLGEGLYHLMGRSVPDRRRAACWKEADVEPLFLALVRRMAERAREHGAPLLVVLVHDAANFTGEPPEVEWRLVAGMEAEGIAVLDTYEPFAPRVAGGEELYLPHDGHWSPAGHHVVAEAIASRLLAERWLEGDRAAPEPEEE